MYTLFILLALSTALFTWSFGRDGPFSRLTIVVAAVASLFLVGSVVVPAALGEATTQLTVTETVGKIPIVAIKDNSLTEGEIRGGIFVVGGYMKEEPVYFYYKRVGDGYVQDWVKALGVVIFEDAPPNVGYLEIHTDTYTVDPIHKEKYLHWVFLRSGYSETVTEIHVPPGTIVHEFVLDAE